MYIVHHMAGSKLVVGSSGLAVRNQLEPKWHRYLLLCTIGTALLAPLPTIVYSWHRTIGTALLAPLVIY